ncbi:MAG: RimK family alpha-L-glutamate ligase [Sphingomonas sp.]|uniref:ATP-grasp domain-containing protein n=1 Tax=Sphingomonas sp. TaxID=28214 RepID=UPI001AC3B6F8|nr:RimK family alpha-L-glutamate ligase [Sphingomonas sp.]MBN8808433.1 RimK family alpha-L-glutamate ligase [Sphingomonas sp.]
MLVGWLLFHRDLEPSLPEVPEVLRFQEAATAQGITLLVFKPQDFDLIVGGGEGWSLTYQGAPVARPDFVLCRTGAETDYATLALLRHLERRGIRLVNGPATIEAVADKLHTLQTLARAGLPVPRTILSKFPIDSALVERELGFPLIVKTLKGTRGAGVLKCEDASQFEDLAGLLASTVTQAEFILQRYIRASHGRDVRVLVVGGRVVAAMERRSLTGGFKSNVSLGGVGAAYNPPNEMAELAVRSAEVLGLDVTGIDILFDEDGYRICEANSAPGFQGLERASGVDIPGAILRWIADTQAARTELAPAVEPDAVVDLVFYGRTGIRALADQSSTFQRFAGSVALQLFAAGARALLQAVLPDSVSNRRGRTRSELRSLYEGRVTSLAVLSDAEQERLLITVLAVSIWTAVLPWLAAAEPAIAGALSILALSFPVVFLLASPARRLASGRSKRIKR